MSIILNKHNNAQVQGFPCSTITFCDLDYTFTQITTQLSQDKQGINSVFTWSLTHGLLFYASILMST